MESGTNDNVDDLLHLAIHRLEKKKQASAGGADAHEDSILLSRLRSQLEAFRTDDPTELPVTERTNGSRGEDAEIGAEDILKELNKVKRQNSITHCLLSIMILLTLAWQVSEFSMIWKVKDGINHPFRSFRNAFSGMFKGSKKDGQDSEKGTSSTSDHLIEAPSIPPIEMPELPHMDFPALGLNGEKE